MVICYMDFTAPLPFSHFCFIFWHQNHFFVKAERWNQSKKSPKWSSLSYWIFWSNGLAERNLVNVDENNLLHLCHCSLRELRISNICTSFKKIANVTVNVKFRVVSLTNSNSLQLPCWFFRTQQHRRQLKFLIINTKLL